MLRVNRLSGVRRAGELGNYDHHRGGVEHKYPSFTVDLGPPGPKQVLCAFACHDSNSVPWTWGPDRLAANVHHVKTGTGKCRERWRFHGRRYCPRPHNVSRRDANGLHSHDMGRHNGTRRPCWPLLFAGLARRHCPYDGGNNQGGVGPGNDVTLNTAGARIVIIAAAALASPPGNFQRARGGSHGLPPVETYLSDMTSDRRGHRIPYSFAGGKYVISGAAFG